MTRETRLPALGGKRHDGAMLPDAPDPTVYAAPFFLISIWVEWWVLKRQRRSGRAVLGYDDVLDTWASLAMGVGSLVTVIMGAIFVVCVLAFRRGIVGESIALYQRVIGQKR